MPPDHAGVRCESAKQGRVDVPDLEIRHVLTRPRSSCPARAGRAKEPAVECRRAVPPARFHTPESMITRLLNRRGVPVLTRVTSPTSPSRGGTASSCRGVCPAGSWGSRAWHGLRQGVPPRYRHGGVFGKSVRPTSSKWGSHARELSLRSQPYRRRGRTNRNMSNPVRPVDCTVSTASASRHGVWWDLELSEGKGRPVPGGAQRERRPRPGRGRAGGQ